MDTELDPGWVSGKRHPDGGYDKIMVHMGSTLYFRTTVLHRLDGPAVIHPDGRTEAWINGVRTD